MITNLLSIISIVVAANTNHLGMTQYEGTTNQFATGVWSEYACPKTVKLTFTTQTNHSYRVQRKPLWINPPVIYSNGAYGTFWNDISTNIPGTGSNISFIFGEPSFSEYVESYRQCYYRIIQIN